LAVDRTYWIFGMPIWLETTAPAGEAEKAEQLHRLLIAQDTGTAIKGLARGDVFWGFGDDAARIAGHMKSPGTMIVLLPLELVRDEGLLK
jgi:membrane-bound lytic murein transglycosylase A